METPKEILDKHINAFYETDKMAVFEDIPMKVFYSAMEEFADIKVKNLALPHVINSEASVCKHCGKLKAEHTTASGMCKDRLKFFEQTDL